MDDTPEDLVFTRQWPASLDRAMLCQACGAVVDWRAERLVCPRCGTRRPSHNAGRLRVPIGDRDGWVCHRCRQAVDRDLASPHPLAAVVDHYPVSLRDGGPPIPANLRIAHSVCNGGVPPRNQSSERWGRYSLTAAQQEVIEAIARLPLDEYRHVRPQV
jgi:hypothetical protein